VRAQAAVVWNFEVCNADVLARRRDHPREHDLAALHAAPVQIAAFADPAQAPAGAPDGRTAGEFAVARTAAAIARFRVCAAAETLAVRWLWALDPAGLAHALEVSAQWRFVGYLCVGRPSPGRTEAARAAGSADPLAGRHLRR
jgi:5,6-dimethylbenzimidazole synthase